jgi:hypothetical protein
LKTSTATTTASTMEDITNNFTSEVKDAWELYFKDYAEDGESICDVKERFLQEKYNTYNVNSSECLDFTHYNLEVYLEMEEAVMNYVDDDWNGYGIVLVVNMWKYMKAEQVLEEEEE